VSEPLGISTDVAGFLEGLVTAELGRAASPGVWCPQCNKKTTDVRHYAVGGVRPYHVHRVGPFEEIHFLGEVLTDG